MAKIKRRLGSGVRIETFASREGLHRGAPEKSQVRAYVSDSGRDMRGRISVRRRGGAHKKKMRIISTLDEFGGATAKIIRFEYDPNRSAHIALVEFGNGKKRYIIAAHKSKIGDEIGCLKHATSEIGNRAELSNIPVGAQVHDIELYPQTAKYLARSAGTYAVLMAIDGDYALLKLPSGELRKVHKLCRATIGQVSNPENSNIKIGKAGRKRNMGIRPQVRGKAMHPRAHPHGGGEGVNPIGLKSPKTPWGKVALGKKTRKKKNSDKFIVTRRGKNG